mmetsp:Transcript_3810/g.10723  ORF Transcript_3810/g.10723 Transcript_3810/m.10723 type:complete len:313 (+) Transcript_3810:602-1540(+)
MWPFVRLDNDFDIHHLRFASIVRNRNGQVIFERWPVVFVDNLAVNLDGVPAFVFHSVAVAITDLEGVTRVARQAFGTVAVRNELAIRVASLCLGINGIAAAFDDLPTSFRSPLVRTHFNFQFEFVAVTCGVAAAATVTAIIAVVVATAELRVDFAQCAGFPLDPVVHYANAGVDAWIVRPGTAVASGHDADLRALSVSVGGEDRATAISLARVLVWARSAEVPVPNAAAILLVAGLRADHVDVHLSELLLPAAALSCCSEANHAHARSDGRGVEIGVAVELDHWHAGRNRRVQLHHHHVLDSVSDIVWMGRP